MPDAAKLSTRAVRDTRETMPQWVHTFTVDASRSHQLTGIGIVIQERRNAGKRRGSIIAQLSELHHDVLARDAEAFAILRALEIAKEKGYSHIKVRSDYNFERRQLRKQYRASLSPADPVRSRILTLARGFTWIAFSYVPRRKNQMAHRLARAAWQAVSLEPAPVPVDEREFLSRGDESESIPDKFLDIDWSDPELPF